MSSIKKKIVSFGDEDEDDASLENKFLHACEVNNLNVVRICINRGANPNCCDNFRKTPLQIAACNNYYKLTELLLSMPNINKNGITQFHATPLYEAALRNHIHIVKLLIEHGADANMKNKTGFSPLHICVIRCWTELIMVLLHHKVHTNTVNCFGKSPLYSAVIDNPNVPIMRALIRHGANMNYYCKQTLPILLEGALNCLNERLLDVMIHFILCGAYINIKDISTGKTALHMVALSNYIPLAEILVAYGADYTITDYANQTPLDIALIHGNRSMILFLQFLHKLSHKERYSYYENLKCSM